MDETGYDLYVDIAQVYSDPKRYKDMIDTLVVLTSQHIASMLGSVDTTSI